MTAGAGLTGAGLPAGARPMMGRMTPTGAEARMP